MRRTVMAMLFGAGVVGLWSAATAGKPAPAPAAAAKEENCGAMMKQTAALPTKFSELMTAIADGMTAHANWVGMSKDPKAQAEATAIKKIAQDHRDRATAGKKAATDMEAAGTLAPAPHDPSKMDPKQMVDAMTKQIALEREMANMMLKNADEGEKRLKEMQAQKGATAQK